MRIARTVVPGNGVLHHIVTRDGEPTACARWNDGSTN